MAMLDAGEALPSLIALATKDRLGNRVSNAEIERTLSSFEKRMITRSFEWVKKSGGDNFVVSNLSSHLWSGAHNYYAAREYQYARGKTLLRSHGVLAEFCSHVDDREAAGHQQTTGRQDTRIQHVLGVSLRISQLFKAICSRYRLGLVAPLATSRKTLRSTP